MLGCSAQCGEEVAPPCVPLPDPQLTGPSRRPSSPQGHTSMKHVRACAHSLPSLPFYTSYMSEGAPLAWPISAPAAHPHATPPPTLVEGIIALRRAKRRNMAAPPVSSQGGRAQTVRVDGLGGPTGRVGGRASICTVGCYSGMCSCAQRNGHGVRCRCWYGVMSHQVLNGVAQAALGVRSVPQCPQRERTRRGWRQVSLPWDSLPLSVSPLLALRCRRMSALRVPSRKAPGPAVSTWTPGDGARGGVAAAGRVHLKVVRTEAGLQGAGSLVPVACHLPAVKRAGGEQPAMGRPEMHGRQTRRRRRTEWRRLLGRQACGKQFADGSDNLATSRARR